MKDSTTTPDPATDALLDMAEAIRTADLAPATRHAARRHLYDTIGAIAGGMSQDVSQALLRVLQPSTLPSGLPLPGTDLRLPPDAFALLTGTAAHGIELDDGYRQGTVHPGVAVVPAVLAAAQTTQASGEALIRAVVAGYETVCALAGAMHPGTRQRGFHPTSVAGPMGAAVAVGLLLDLDRRQMSDALGIAASGAGGLFAFLGGGGDVKRLHGGQAARAGLMAALCAAEGISAPTGIIGRDSGYAWAFADRPVGRPLDLDLPPSGSFRIEDCYIKAHACCRHLQPAFEALVHLVQKHEIPEADILRIEIDTYTIAARHARVGWNDFASAQLSLPYVMALAVRYGRADLSMFDDAMRGAWAGPIADRLHVAAPPDIDELYPSHRPARVRIVTPHNQLEETRLEASGSREMPLSDTALRDKFRGLAGNRAEAWDEAVWTLPASADAGSRIRQIFAA